MRLVAVTTEHSWAQLSLGVLLAYAGSALHELSTHYIQTSLDDFDRDVHLFQAGDYILFSNYLWNVDVNLALCRAIKDRCAVTAIHGGPSTPSYRAACEAFLTDNPWVDFAIHGEGEAPLVDLLRAHRLDPTSRVSIAGVSFCDGDGYVHGGLSHPVTDLACIPSPYLLGTFRDACLSNRRLILETNRGCPYRCAYCDWGRSDTSRVRCFPKARVRAEIEWACQQQIHELFIADANFGILERDEEIANWLAEERIRWGYPKRVIVMLSKKPSKRVVNIVETLARSNLITSGYVGYQTHCREVLSLINRDNISNSDHTDIRAAYRRAGVPISIQLMFALPGATVDSFKRDLGTHFFDSSNVQTYQTYLLPNSPMADPAYVERYRLEADQRGLIISTSTLSREDVRYLERLAHLFQFAKTQGGLFYILCYLKWAARVEPIAFLTQLLAYARESTGLLEALWRDPLPKGDSLFALPNLRERLRAEQLWASFYDELKTMITTLDVSLVAKELDVVLMVQRAVMPEKGKTGDDHYRLPYDYAQYFRDNLHDYARRLCLSEYSEGELWVRDPKSLSNQVLARTLERNAVDWELDSVLKELRTTPSRED